MQDAIFANHQISHLEVIFAKMCKPLHVSHHVLCEQVNLLTRQALINISPAISCTRVMESEAVGSFRLLQDTTLQGGVVKCNRKSAGLLP